MTEAPTTWPVSWRATLAIVVLSTAGLTWFMAVHDNMPIRILIYSVGQSIPIAMTLRLVLAQREGRVPHWYRDEAGIETGGVGHVSRGEQGGLAELSWPDLQRQVDWYVAQGMLKTHIDVNTVIDKRYLVATAAP